MEDKYLVNYDQLPVDDKGLVDLTPKIWEAPAPARGSDFQRAAERLEAYGIALDSPEGVAALTMAVWSEYLR